MSRLGRRITQGGRSEIYEWGERHVVKLYPYGCTRSQVEREMSAAQAAHAAAIKTPAAVSMTTIKDRVGIVFERIEGPTMLQGLSDRPGQAAALADQLAELQVDLHKHEIPTLPAQREWLRPRIARAHALSKETRSGLLAALEQLPEANTLCHGDCQPGNIILTSAGPIIIDWFDATRGNALADMARTLLLIRHAQIPEQACEQVLHVTSATRDRFCAAYWRRYTELRPTTLEQLALWAPLVAAARLGENPGVAEREVLLAIAHGKPLLDV